MGSLVWGPSSVSIVATIGTAIQQVAGMKNSNGTTHKSSGKRRCRGNTSPFEKLNVINRGKHHEKPAHNFAFFFCQRVSQMESVRRRRCVALLRRDAAKSQICKMQMQKSAAYFRAAAELPASPTLKASLVAALVYTASSLYFICSPWSEITEAQCLPTYATS